MNRGAEEPRPVTQGKRAAKPNPVRRGNNSLRLKGIQDLSVWYRARRAWLCVLMSSAPFAARIRCLGVDVAFGGGLLLAEVEAVWRVPNHPRSCQGHPLKGLHGTKPAFSLAASPVWGAWLKPSRQVSGFVPGEVGTTAAGGP